jgi:hypothetical protein
MNAVNAGSGVDDGDLSPRLRRSFVSLTKVQAPCVDRPLRLELAADGFEQTKPAELAPEEPPPPFTVRLRRI